MRHAFFNFFLACLVFIFIGLSLVVRAQNTQQNSQPDTQQNTQPKSTASSETAPRPIMIQKIEAKTKKNKPKTSTSTQTSTSTSSSAELAPEKKLIQRDPIPIEHVIEAALKPQTHTPAYWYQHHHWAPPEDMNFCEAHTLGARWIEALPLHIDCKASKAAKKMVHAAAQVWNQHTPQPVIQISNTCSPSARHGDKKSSLSFIQPEPEAYDLSPIRIRHQTTAEALRSQLKLTAQVYAYPLFYLGRKLYYKYFNHNTLCKEGVKKFAGRQLGCTEYRAVAETENNKLISTHPENWLKLTRGGFATEYEAWAKKNNFSIQYYDDVLLLRPPIQPQYIAEADIYINADLFNFTSPAVEFLQLFVLVHEMGHALGLRHQPLPNNLMSFKWEAAEQLFMPLIADALQVSSKPQNYKITDSISQFYSNPLWSFMPSIMQRRELIDLMAHNKNFNHQLTQLVQLQKQDKKALGCLYDLKSE